MTAIQRDASEHLVHRLLAALAAHPDGATVAQLQADLGPVPPEALARRLNDLAAVDLAGGLFVGGVLVDAVLTTKGRARAAAIQGAPWTSSHSTPPAAPTAANPSTST